MSGAPEQKTDNIPEVEITPEMIEAGIDAYYENALWGWENPGRSELAEMMAAIHRAMTSVRRAS